jgi:hypothetical protein
MYMYIPSQSLGRAGSVDPLADWMAGWHSDEIHTTIKTTLLIWVIRVER